MDGDPFDLVVIGGGINGAGIARDAAGRGLRVLLVEQDDLAAHTSSASTKLIHGGLRYLENREFRLVRDSLRERERLMRIAPHLITPLRFIVPLGRSSRPRWLIRLGLWLYDHIGGRVSLPASVAVDLAEAAGPGVLAPGLARGFAYSDCRTDDSRLVIANAQDAAERGATILTGTAMVSARIAGDLWDITLEPTPGRPAPDHAAPSRVSARALVNAAGPWAASLLDRVDGMASAASLRLVKGSHIVVPRHYPGDHAFLFQNPDGRIVFAIPWLDDFTAIGTTDVPVGPEERAEPRITETEIDYLLASANGWFARPVERTAVVHSWSGVRPLVDDGKADAKAITRDYVLRLGRESGPQVLSVFGGKLTTYRRLADQALARLAPWLPQMGPAWTAGTPLPGGDLPDGDLAAWQRTVQERWPFLAPALANRLAASYGTRAALILGDAASMTELGEHFGGGLTTAEVNYLRAHEWAMTAHDVLWRRTCLGVSATPEMAARLAAAFRAKP